ncbi:N-acetylglucosamine-1-P-mutase [Chitinispirillum alkaliphilum]|nr:N-acetylglucosamine-1-P-mutase [Chitinispirillum alkaliphilum]
MDTALFKGLVEKNSMLLENLRKKRVFIIAGINCGGLLCDLSIADKSAEALGDVSEESFQKLIGSDFINNYENAVLIDFSKTLSLYDSSDLPEEERINTAFTMSRVNFMGTDGIRGKVVLQTKDNFIADLLNDNAFTPDLVEACSYSFAQILLENGIVKAGDTIITGNDGRDSAYEWKLNTAMRDGFCKASLNVLDLGTVPTAMVPYNMLKKQYRGGAMLTASHNPSNQNGIKFFLDGKKLLPEGNAGDFVLSALMYNYCLLESLPEKSGSVESAENVLQQGTDFCISVLPDNSAEVLKDTHVVLDTANGAFSQIGIKVFDTLGLTYSSVNEEPKGSNINRDCGVVDIEGVEYFDSKEYDSCMPSVKEVFNKGRTLEKGNVFGIALDGDGDRGFLLYYDKELDRVNVIDGDKCGYILSEYLIKKHKLNPSEYYFVSTIESDLMTSSSAAAQLGLKTSIVSVGDKYICNFSEGKLLCGLETSGHLIFPIPVQDSEGEEKILLSGIGLLTGLMSLIAVKELDLPGERIVEPFEPGVSKTSYVYFVDKSKFYKNSEIWNKCKEQIVSEIEELKELGKLDSELGIRFEDKEDPNVLYASLVDGQGVQGCIFLRNSGTEDKSAVYVKGTSKLKEPLFLIGKKLQLSQTAVMKNKNRIEYFYENFIIETLKNKRSVSVQDILTALNTESGKEISESDLYGVIHGLKKEERLNMEESTISLL